MSTPSAIRARRVEVFAAGSVAADTALFTAIQPDGHASVFRCQVFLASARALNVVWTDGTSTKKTPVKEGATARVFTFDVLAPKLSARGDSASQKAMSFTIEHTGGSAVDVDQVVVDELEGVA